MWMPQTKIRLYNALSRRIEVFKPLRSKKVGLYTCGPTVYDYAHIGNLRTYIFEDVLHRALEANGYRVKQIMNITDIEDKIIKKALAEKRDIKEITAPLTKSFLDDIKKLNIRRAVSYPKATEHIKEMLALIKQLLDKGIAYRGADGSIYFAISKFKDYGKLSRLSKRKIKIGARVAADEYSKNEARDFVLWKARKSGEPFWHSPFGDGRPGWHIECSAMSMRYLGEHFDIHAGGVDLIFPHHENEIAQSQAAGGKKFVNYWVEGEHLLVNGQKMAKSLGNFYTLRDLEKRNFNFLSFRYLVLMAHYRSPLNFTWKNMQAAESGLEHLYNSYVEIKEKAGRRKPNSPSATARKYENDFLKTINDDLNTPRAMSLVSKMFKDKNLEPAEKAFLLEKFDEVLGLDIEKSSRRKLKIPSKIKELLEKRKKYRTSKQFIQADALRKEIERLGFKVEDTPRGPMIKKFEVRS